MSTNHNRIKVADLETNQQNKILTTNSAGELEFTDINTIQVDSYNALDYTSEGKALDARQGKVLKDLTDNKVDKVNGKNLLSDTEITRLGTLSNYNHPTNHAPSIITQDTNNRFVTDTEKATWNAKQSSLPFVPENVTNKNIAGGYAGLGSDGKLISSQLPAITINDTFVIASQAAMLAQTAQTGDLAVRTDLNKSFILKGTNPAVLSDWQELLTPTSAVTTVFGRNGAITSQTGDYTADQISETASRKFQSANQQAFNDATSSIQTQLNTKVSTTGSGASGTWGINITGNANTATNSSQIGGISSNRVMMKRRTRIDAADSTSLNSSITQPEMGFTYGGSGEPRGPYIAFGGLNGDIDYSCQLAGAYVGGNEFKIRTKNDDAAIWNPWRTLITDGNYAAYSTFSGIVSSGNGFQTSSYLVNSRNRIWAFGNADGYGLSYFQGTAGQYGTDSIGIHFGNSTNALSKFIFASNGDLITTGLTTSVGLGIAQTNGAGQGLSLYSSAVSGKPSYGLMFATTSNYSTHGAVNGDWATYLTMDGANNRGWIFRLADTNVASISATGVFTGSTFVGALAGNAATATASQRLSFVDGPRNLSDRLPNSFARTVNFDFVNAATVGGSGSYGGVMTFAPWDGLTSSTGDSSYQLAFRNESGINGSGLPGLRLRKGIDTAWGGWYDMLHSGNYTSFSAFSGAITGASLTVTGDVTAFSDSRVKENIRPIVNVIERIQASRGILYDRIDTKQKNNIGFIAQELEETFPELVLTREDGTKAVKYQNAVAVLFEAIKTQQTQIEKQQQIIEEQNDKIKFILKHLNLQS